MVMVVVPQKELTTEDAEDRSQRSVVSGQPEENCATEGREEEQKPRMNTDQHGRESAEDSKKAKNFNRQVENPAFRRSAKVAKVGKE